MLQGTVTRGDFKRQERYTVPGDDVQIKIFQSIRKTSNLRKELFFLKLQFVLPTLYKHKGRWFFLAL